MEFEHIEYRKGLPYKLFLVSIGYRSHHFHSELEIIYVLKGSVRIQIAQTSHTIEAGQVFIINPYEIHSIENMQDEGQDNNILLIIQITTHAHALSKSILSHIHFSERLLTSQGEPIIQLLFLLYEQSFKDHPSVDYHLNGLFQIFIGNLLASIPYSTNTQGLQNNQSEDFERLKFLIDYVEAHYREKLYLDELAHSLHLSKFYLSHFIKQHLGINFQTYLNNVRLTSAISLLINTDLGILELSTSAGFSDQKYLNSMIKSKYNCTAKALRNTLRQQLKTTNPNTPIGSVHLPFDQEEAMGLIATKQQHCHILSTTS